MDCMDSHLRHNAWLNQTVADKNTAPRRKNRVTVNGNLAQIRGFGGARGRGARKPTGLLKRNNRDICPFTDSRKKPRYPRF